MSLAALSMSFPLADGDPGIAQTVDWIRKLVDDGKRDFEINQLAGGLVRNIPSSNLEQRAKRIFDAVVRRVKFVEDIRGAETLRPAIVTWKQGFGDCDDINAILLPSLYETIGYNVRLVTVAADCSDPTQFSHIYAEVEIDGEWVPVDAARPGARWRRPPGEYPRVRVWSLDDEGYEDVRGLNGLGLIGDTTTDIASLIPAIEGGAAQVIGAAEGNNPFAPQQQQPTIGLFSSSGWIWVLLIGGVLVFALKKR